MPIWEYIGSMARAATTSDAFNAVAEPRRRDILNYLALQERSVSEIVDALEMEQPWEDTFLLRRHDGEFRWHLSRAMPFRQSW